MKKLLAILLAVALVATSAMAVMAAVADPASVGDHPAPAGLQLIKGEIIGNELGWPGDNPDTGADKAWDGDFSTFYDSVSGMIRISLRI
jgi:Spy/CpxP family protein refolding chaperone